jgi:hypothetical protein
LKPVTKSIRNYIFATLEKYETIEGENQPVGLIAVLEKMKNISN